MKKKMEFQSLFTFVHLFIIHIFFLFLFTSVYIRSRLLRLRYNVFISCSNSDTFCLELGSNESIERRTFTYGTEILKLFPATRFTTDRFPLLQISPPNSRLKQQISQFPRFSRALISQPFHLGKKI